MNAVVFNSAFNMGGSYYAATANAARAWLTLQTSVDVFAAIAPPRFPGGTRLRTPLHVLAMLWFAMRDRL